MLTEDEPTPTAGAIATEAAQEGKDSKSRHYIVGGIIGVAVFASLFLVSWGYAWFQRGEQVKAGEVVVTDVTAACKDKQLAAQMDAQVPGICDTADKAAEVITEGPQGKQGNEGQKGDKGDQGPGPTSAQVNKAVSLYCANDRCIGKPTAAQVLAAVTILCADGSCNGEDGEDSQVPGPQGERGPAPTPEQMLATVTEYCADGKCKGEKGDKGDQGEPGTPAYPFSFKYTVPGNPPLQEDKTYLVTCTTPGVECEVTEVTEEPQQP